MDLGIAGKVALVTASSKGLGRATAIALAAEGVKVVITARGETALAKTAAEIEQAGGIVHAIVGDVTNVQTPALVVAETVERFGGLDILIANAGGPPPVRALEVTDDLLASAVNNNLTTSVRLVQAALPHMQEQRWGRICLIASVTVKQPAPGNALSNAARTGLWAWAKTASQDVFADGITINLACPGLHDTDRVKELGGAADGRPMGNPADFGSVVTFLCSQQAAFVSGSAVQIDGASITGLL